MEKSTKATTIITGLAYVGILLSIMDSVIPKAISGLILFAGYLIIFSEMIEKNIIAIIAIAIIGAIIGTQVGVEYLYISTMIFILIITISVPDGQKIPPRITFLIIGLLLISVGTLATLFQL